jgi:hypothetical protein
MVKSKGVEIWLRWSKDICHSIALRHFDDRNFTKVILFIPHNPIGIRPADNPCKSRLLQATQRALCYTTTGFAMRIPDVVKKTTTTFENPVELLVKSS